MSVEQVVSYIEAAKTELKIEYRRTKTEAQAFRNFHDRVEDIEAVQPCPDGGSALLRTRNSHPAATSTCKRVKQAYEETLLDMPHYSEEYDERLCDHMAAEFGEEVVANLCDSPRLTLYVKRALVTASRNAHEQRTAFLTPLKSELNALTTAETTLREIAGVLQHWKQDQPGNCSFSKLQSIYEALQIAQARCERLARTRQQALHSSNWARPSGALKKALHPYLYAELDVTYPILADVAECSRDLQRSRKQVIQAIARAR